MPIAPTRFSRVSIGFLDSVTSLVGRDPADTGAVLSVTGPAVFSDAQTFSSSASFGGNVTASSGLFVGDAAAANELVAISAVTASLDFPSINPLESSSVITFAMSGLTRGDTIILTPDALWPVTAAHRDLSYFASSSSTAGEAHAWAINSTLTAVNATATVFRAVRINHPSYI